MDGGGETERKVTKDCGDPEIKTTKRGEWTTTPRMHCSRKN